MKKLLMILAITALLSACGNTENAKQGTNETPEATSSAVTASTDSKSKQFTTYSGEGFSFSYPESWKKVDTSQIHASVKAAFSNQSTGTNFADNVNLTIEANTSGSVNPEEFANNTADYYIQNGDSIGISNYKKTSYNTKAYKEINAGVLEGTYTNATGVEVVMVQYMIPTNTNLYTLTLSYGKDTYNSDEATEILDSLNITSALEQTTQDTSTPNSSNAATVADFFNDLTPFVTSDAAVLEQVSYDFFAEHTDLFPADSADLRKKLKSLVTSGVTTRHLNKNVANYYQNFIQISGQVIQIEEDNSLGSTLSVVLIADENDNNITAIYPSTTGDLLEGDYATVIGVPIANYSFENVSGGYTNSTLVGAALVETE